MASASEQEDKAPMSTDAAVRRPSPAFESGETRSRRGSFVAEAASSKRPSLAGEELHQLLASRRQKVDTEGVHFTKLPFSRQNSEDLDEGEEGVATVDASSSRDAENSQSSSPSPFKIRRIIADAQTLVDIRENLELLQVGLRDESQARKQLTDMVLQESEALRVLRAECQDEYRKLKERLDLECMLREEASRSSSSTSSSASESPRRVKADCQDEYRKLNERLEVSFSSCSKALHPDSQDDGNAQPQSLPPLKGEAELQRNADQQVLSCRLSEKVAQLEEQLKHLESSVQESQARLSTWITEHRTRQERLSPNRQDKTECIEPGLEESALCCKENCPENSSGPLHFLLATPKPMNAVTPKATPTPTPTPFAATPYAFGSGRYAMGASSNASGDTEEAELREEVRVQAGRLAALHEAHAHFASQLGEGLHALNGRVAVWDDAQVQLKEQLTVDRTAVEKAVSSLTENIEDTLNRQVLNLRALVLEEVDQRGEFFDGVQRGLEDVLSKQNAKYETELTELENRLIADTKCLMMNYMDELRGEVLRHTHKLSL